MNIVLKLKHLIGTLVLKILESLRRKENSGQSVRSPGGFGGKAQPGDTLPPPNEGIFAPNPQLTNYDYYLLPSTSLWTSFALFLLLAHQ